MQAFSIEQSIMEGELKVKDLFGYVCNNAVALDGYEMEKEILLRVMKI